MSPLTLFLSKMIGLFAIVFGLSMLSNKQGSVTAVAAILHDPGLVLISGIFALSVGLAMILGHNVWSGGALPIVVTLIGWLSTIKGLVLLFLSSDALAAYAGAIHYEQAFYVYAAVMLAIGAYLAYGGFRADSRL